jgi:hypothetical protein
MPTTVVKTIGSSGQDFTTPQLWINSLANLNLVTADQIQQGQLDNEEFLAAGVVADFTALAGLISDATHYVELTTKPGASFRDNANVRTYALYYNSSNGAALRSTSGNTVHLNDAAIRLTGLQISGDTGSSTSIFSDAVGAGHPQIVSGCIIQGTEVQLQNNAAVTFNNSLLINLTGTFNRALVVSGVGPYNFNFCTIVLPTGVTSTAIIDCSNVTTTVNLENDAVFGASSSITSRSGSATITYTTCANELGSPPAGVTQMTFANQFVSTTNDFRQKAGAGLRGAGTADATNGAHDISGLARPQGSNWDIGAWEVAASGGGGMIPILGSGSLRALPLWYVADRLRKNRIIGRRRFLSGFRW